MTLLNNVMSYFYGQSKHKAAVDFSHESQRFEELR